MSLSPRAAKLRYLCRTAKALITAQCRSFSGYCRWLWNKFLEINLLWLHNKQKIIYYGQMDFFSKLFKNSEEYGFVA